MNKMCFGMVWDRKKLLAIIGIASLLLLINLSYAWAITAQEVIAMVDKTYRREEKRIRDMTIVQEIYYRDAKETGIKFELVGEETIMLKGKKGRIEVSHNLEEIKSPSLPRIQVYTDKNTWLKLYSGAVKRIAKGGQSRNPAHSLRNFQATKMIGRELINGRAAYHLRGRKEYWQERREYWIDANRWKIVKIKATVTLKGSTVKEVVTLYKNFRKVGGIRWLPYRTENYLNKKFTAYRKVKEVKVNQGLKDSLFAPLKETEEPEYTYEYQR